MVDKDRLRDAVRHFLFRVDLSDSSSSRPVTAREYTELVSAIKELINTIISEME